MGVGHFYPMMPSAWRPGARRSGIELDSITGRIAKPRATRRTARRSRKSRQAAGEGHEQFEDAAHGGQGREASGGRQCLEM